MLPAVLRSSGFVPTYKYLATAGYLNDKGRSLKKPADGSNPK
jgi:hypothetical protein